MGADPGRARDLPQGAVALVGMAGRFPGAADVEALWANLLAGVESIVRVTDEDALAAGVPLAVLEDPLFVRAAAPLEDGERFDAALFGYLPREAELIDPQHRQFLECAWEALESAGYTPSNYPGRIGLFGGVAKDTYHQDVLRRNPRGLDGQDEYSLLIAGEKDFPTSRVAYKLGLRGPCIGVQTACSTSAVAVHLACQSLLTGECDMVLAGGARVLFPERAGYRFEPGGILSPDGHCRAFDEAAAGTVRGSGVAFVVLRRLEDAVLDRDFIHAVILGTAINNDGMERASYTAPGVRGQATVIAEALAVAGAHPETIGYVEAHGTGTAVGDPIEVLALTRAFREGTERTGFCGLGSLKTNIGHLDAAAGVAGLIKAALVVREGLIPANLHFRAPNPGIDLEDSPFRVVAASTRWEREDRPRRAGVSSFGLGGTNAHIVIEEPPARPESDPGRAWSLLPISARTPEALERAGQRLLAFLGEHRESPLEDVAFTLQEGRRAFPHRKAVVCRRTPAGELDLFPDPEHGWVSAASPVETEPSVVFLLPGGGAQYPGMARELMATEPFFRREVEASLAVLEESLQGDILGLLSAEDEDEDARQRLQRPFRALPALFATEYALARLLGTWGIRPGALTGHSMGEYTAACLAGVLRPEDAMRLVARRGRLFEGLAAGAMASVPLGRSDLEALDMVGVWVAAENLPGRTVIAGEEAALRQFEKRLEGRGVASQRLHIPVAAHSPLVDPILADFRAVLVAMEFGAPRLPFISNVTGDWISEEQARSPEYWVAHLRSTVRFADGVSRLLERGPGVMVEVGPGRTLGSFVRMHGGRAKHHSVLNTMPHPLEPLPGVPVLLQAVGTLWALGAPLDWEAFRNGARRCRVPLPTYPFEGKRHVIEVHGGLGQLFVGAHGANGASDPRPEPARARDELPLLVPAGNGAAPGVIPAAETRDPALAALESDPALERLLQLLSEISGLPITEIDPGATFLELGFESLSLTQVSMAIRRDLGVEVAFRDMLERYTTPEALAASVAALGRPDALAARGAPAPPPAPPPPEHAPSEEKATPLGGTSEGPHGPWRPPSGAAAVLTERQRQHVTELVRRIEVRTPRSKRLTQKNRARLADPRTVEGFNRAWKEIVYPVVASGSSGSRIQDIDGNDYLDVTMGFGVALLGHSPSFVRDAVSKRIELGVEIGPQTPLAGEVAERISRLTGAERVAFCNTGSEAVLAALRCARTVTGREMIATFAGDYHGIFDEVLARGLDRQGQRTSVPIAPGITGRSVQGTLVLDYDSLASLQTIEERAGQLAAVLVEPVQSRHPDLQPRQFLRRLREVTEKAGIPLIFDEMITGFRCHPGGIQALWGISADMVTYGKVVGGGYPIGVLAGRARYLDALDGGPWQFGDDSFPTAGVTWFAGTFVRHPVALAAASATLQHLAEAGGALQADLNSRTGEFVRELNRRFSRMGAPIHVETFSSLFLITFPPGYPHAPLFYLHLRDQGVHVTQNRSAFLSTAHTEQDLEFLLDAFERSARELQRGGFLPGSESHRGAPVAEVGSAHEGRGGEAEPGVQVFPLTPAQQGIWLTSAWGPEASCSFNLSTRLHMRGTLQVEALREALDGLAARHEALRITIDPGGVNQHLHALGRLPLALVDLRGTGSDRRDRGLAEAAKHEATTPFDLSEGPLVRARLVRLADDEQMLFLTVHHVACDGWSCGVMLKDLGALYTAHVDGRTPDLPAPTGFSAYLGTEARRRAGPAGDAARRFWLSRFRDHVPVLDPPSDRLRPSRPTFQAARRELPLAPQLVERLREVVRPAGSTLFAGLLAAFTVLIRQLYGQRDVVVGISSADQSALGLPELVGHCVNVLPFRFEVDDEESFRDHVRRTSTGVLDAFEHQAVGFEGLLREIKLPREPGRTPLVSVVFNLDPTMAGAHFRDLEVETDSNPRSYESFDLFFNVVLAPRHEHLECTYRRDLFDPGTVDLWLQRFSGILEQAGEAPGGALRHLSPGISVGGGQPSRSPGPGATEDVEAELGRLWEELLGVEGVRAEDDFFLVGGHSLLAVRLVSRIRDRWGFALPLAEIFEWPTLRAMAERLEERLHPTTPGDSGPGPGGEPHTEMVS